MSRSETTKDYKTEHLSLAIYFIKQNFINIKLTEPAKCLVIYRYAFFI